MTFWAVALPDPLLYWYAALRWVNGVVTCDALYNGPCSMYGSIMKNGLPNAPA